MNIQLSEAQKRRLFELVLLEGPFTTGFIKPKEREAMLKAGLIALEPHPTSKRTKQMVATETGWVWVVDHLGEPFEESGIRVRHLWNRLAANVANYLRENGIEPRALLSPPKEASASEAAGGAEGEGSAPEHPESSPKGVLREGYLALSGGKLRERIRIKDLRARVSLSSEVFDRALIELLDEGVVVLYPEDDRSRLDEAEHQAALDLSGVPQHIIYWER